VTEKNRGSKSVKHKNRFPPHRETKISGYFADERGYGLQLTSSSHTHPRLLRLDEVPFLLFGYVIHGLHRHFIYNEAMNHRNR